MSQLYQALSVPPAGNERGGIEVLRCAIIDGELHVTLRPIFDEPNDWGRLFAAVARQVARVYADQDRFSDTETLSRIGSAFEAEMGNPTDVVGSIGPIGGA